MLKGIIPIIATTFAADESIDYASFRRELQYMKKAGCQGATLFGIAGEYYKLTDAECEKLIDVTVDECKRLNLPSVISCTPHSTAAAVARGIKKQSPLLSSSIVSPATMRWALYTIRLSSACRNTRVSCITGTAPLPIRSCSTQPGPTGGS